MSMPTRSPVTAQMHTLVCSHPLPHPPAGGAASSVAGGWGCCLHDARCPPPSHSVRCCAL
eukprot:1159685-Pelagomonas_calceolata.AAC.1